MTLLIQLTSRSFFKYLTTNHFKKMYKSTKSSRNSNNKHSKLLNSTPTRPIGLSRNVLKFISPMATPTATPEKVSVNEDQSTPKRKRILTPVKDAELCGHILNKKIEPKRFKSEIAEGISTSELYTLSIEELDKEIADSKNRISLRENELKKLEGSKKESLDDVIKIWLSGCQTALEDLLDNCRKMNENMNMEDLLNGLGIPPELVNFNIQDEEFIIRN